jgi:cytochrome c5
MYVPSRASHSGKLLRTPFRSRVIPSGARANPAAERSEVTVTRITQREHPQAPAALESELGEATYNCTCGYVFEAPVLTSVDCPHCGDSQAW